MSSECRESSENLPTDYSSWFTKNQAAEAIDVSTKMIERMALRGDIRKVRDRNIATGIFKVLFHPEDVERIARGRRPGLAPFAKALARKPSDPPPLSTEQRFRVKQEGRAWCRLATKRLIASGVIPRRPCNVCGSQERLHIHHEDYTDPMQVRWLCRMCHNREHYRLRQAAKVLHPLKSFKNMGPDYSTWLTKQKVAQQLDVSTKTVEKLAREGKIQQALWKRPVGGPALVVYYPDDVARLLATKREVVPFVVPDLEGKGNGHGSASVAVQAPPVTSWEDLLRAIGAILMTTHSERFDNPQNSRKFLTIPEASAWIGLTEAYLLRAIRDGRLPARKDRGWKIRKTDLEAL